MHGRSAAGRRRTDLNSDQSQLVRGPLPLSLFWCGSVNTRPSGCVIGNWEHRVRWMQGLFPSAEVEPPPRGARALTAAEVDASSDTEPRRRVVYPATQQINGATWNAP